MAALPSAVNRRHLVYDAEQSMPCMCPDAESWPQSRASISHRTSSLPSCHEAIHALIVSCTRAVESTPEARLPYAWEVAIRSRHQNSNGSDDSDDSDGSDGKSFNGSDDVSDESMSGGGSSDDSSSGGVDIVFLLISRTSCAHGRKNL